MYLLNRLCKRDQKNISNNRLEALILHLEMLFNSFSDNRQKLPTSFGVNRWNLQKTDIERILSESFVRFDEVEISENQIIVKINSQEYKFDVFNGGVNEN